MDEPKRGQLPQPDPDDYETALDNKIVILPGARANLSAATFVLNDEDHTLGNVLRYMIMKNPDVEFCGYSIPHPSEAKVHLRIQMYDNKSGLDALKEALANLDGLFEALAVKYEAALTADGIDRAEAEPIDWEPIRKRIEQNKRDGLLPGTKASA